MALPIRLLCRLGGRRRLPPPPVVLSHLSSSAQNPSQHPPTPIPPLPLPPRVLTFSVPARSFSWYSRSGSPSPSPTGPAAAEDPDEDAYTERESVHLDDVSGVDYGEGLASAAGGAEATVSVVASGDGGGVSGLAIGTVVDALDGFHSLTGLPW